GRVIDLMNQHLPEGVSPLLPLGVRVPDHAGKLRLAYRLDELARLLLEGRPARADGIQIGKIVGMEPGTRGDALPALEPAPLGFALPALEPDPPGVHDVHEGIPHGTKARAPGLGELRRGEAGRGVEDAFIRPRAVPIECANVLDAHLSSLRPR